MSNTDPNFPAPGDPAYAQYLRSEYTSDGTHPNVAGMAAMANAVDLNALQPSAGQRTGRITWNGGVKCVDRNVASGHVQIWDCLAGSNQLWTLNLDGSLTTGGLCMELPVGQFANHTLVDTAPCTGTSSQRWSRVAGASLVNQASGRCLDLDGGDYTNGRQLQVYDCIGGPNQIWVIPT